MVKYCSLDINQMHGNVSKSGVGPSFQTEPKSGGGKFLKLSNEKKRFFGFKLYSYILPLIFLGFFLAHMLEMQIFLKFFSSSGGASTLSITTNQIFIYTKNMGVIPL